MIDTREMNVVHIVFRREFWQLPLLVRGVLLVMAGAPRWSQGTPT